MRTLVKDLELAEAGQSFGPDPVLMKKTGNPNLARDIDDFKSKIRDKAYMDHAINRIAMELMHFLSK